MKFFCAICSFRLQWVFVEELENRISYDFESLQSVINWNVFEIFAEINEVVLKLCKNMVTAVLKR